MQATHTRTSGTGTPQMLPGNERYHADMQRRTTSGLMLAAQSSWSASRLTPPSCWLDADPGASYSGLGVLANRPRWMLLSSAMVGLAQHHASSEPVTSASSHWPSCCATQAAVAQFADTQLLALSGTAASRKGSSCGFAGDRRRSAGMPCHAGMFPASVGLKLCPRSGLNAAVGTATTCARMRQQALERHAGGIMQANGKLEVRRRNLRASGPAVRLQIVRCGGASASHDGETIDGTDVASRHISLCLVG